MKTTTRKIWQTVAMGVIVLLGSGLGTAFAADDADAGNPVEVPQYPTDDLDPAETQAEELGGGGSGPDALWMDFLDAVCFILPWLIKAA